MAADGKAGKEVSMPPYQIEHIRDRVVEAVGRYNGSAGERDRIDRVSLFGSYAEGRASASSDVDLLVSFSSPAVSLISLARALEAMEDSLGVPVDLVQEPLPQGSLLTIGKAVPLYGAA